MNVVLYPWTKPDQLYQGNEFWNSEDNPINNALFGDWWDWQSLRYVYDDYLVSSPVLTTSTLNVRVSLKIAKEDYKRGDYTLKWN